jgi:hypothetical protein
LAAGRLGFPTSKPSHSCWVSTSCLSAPITEPAGGGGQAAARGRWWQGSAPCLAAVPHRPTSSHVRRVPVVHCAPAAGVVADVGGRAAAWGGGAPLPSPAGVQSYSGGRSLRSLRLSWLDRPAAAPPPRPALGPCRLRTTGPA